VKTRRIPLTASGWTVAVLAVVAYIGGWQLGWVELMVVAAGCLIVLAVAVPFVIGRLTLDVERTLEPDRVTVGDGAVAVMRVTNRAARRSPRVSSRSTSPGDLFASTSRRSDRGARRRPSTRCRPRAAASSTSARRSS
jgi:uncharacterized protein (DUF58 family)